MDRRVAETAEDLKGPVTRHIASAWHDGGESEALFQIRGKLEWAQGGPRLKQFDLPAVTPNYRLVHCSPDGQVAYPDGARGLAGIWLQSLNGSRRSR